MDDEAGPATSALEAWAATVMSGAEGTGTGSAAGVDRAPGNAHYDPADVITVFMSARESAKQRINGTPAGGAQPS
jgi:hypothetical protein